MEKKFNLKGKKKLFNFVTSSEVLLSEVQGQDVVSLIHPFSLIHYTIVKNNINNSHISIQSSSLQFLLRSFKMKNFEIESKLFGTGNLIYKFCKCDSRSEAEIIILQISQSSDSKFLPNISFYKRNSEIELNYNFSLKKVYEDITNLIDIICPELFEVFKINDPKNNLKPDDFDEYYPKLKDCEGKNCKYSQLMKYLEDLLITYSRKEKPFKIQNIYPQDWEEVSANFTYKVFKDSNKAKLFFNNYKSAIDMNIPLLNSVFIPFYVDYNNKMRTAVRISNVKGSLIDLSNQEELNNFIESVVEDNNYENAKRIVRIFDLAHEKGLETHQFIYTYPFKTGTPIGFVDGLCNIHSRNEIFKSASNKIRNIFNF